MKHVLILQNKILHYRKALYNELAKHHKITVLHSGNSSLEKDDLYEEIIVDVKKAGPFFFQKQVIQKIKSGNYDAVIAMFDVRWLTNIYAMFAAERNRITFVWWGVYFTENNIANWLRKTISKRNHSIVFYSRDAKERFIEAGISEEKLFVANNTFHIENRVEGFKNTEKDLILFVGSLDPRKELEILIKAFYNIQSDIPAYFKLAIVGDGQLFNNIGEKISEMGMENKVEMPGKITNTEALVSYYKRAVVSVSFGQAGLSVLQSMGYGVPFMTKKKAISGGEKSNIIHGENGFLIDNDLKVLEEKLLYLCNDIDRARMMGKKAYQHYSEYGTITNMVEGFNKALEYKSRI